MAQYWNGRLPTPKSLAKISNKYLRVRTGVENGRVLRKRMETVRDIILAKSPDASDRRLVDAMLNEADAYLSGSYGVEQFTERGVTVKYVSMGGAYDITLIWNTDTGSLYVGAWGDLAERLGA